MINWGGVQFAQFSNFCQSMPRLFTRDRVVPPRFGFRSAGPAFLDIHQVEERHQIRPLSQSGVLATANQAGCAAVPPSAFHHKRVPDFDLLIIRTPARFEAPFEDFLIAPTLQGAGRERIEIHFQKSTDPIIERPVSRDESQMVTLRQLALGVEANFIKDSTEEDDAANGISGTAEWEGHGKSWV